MKGAAEAQPRSHLSREHGWVPRGGNEVAVPLLIPVRASRRALCLPTFHGVLWQREQVLPRLKMLCCCYHYPLAQTLVAVSPPCTPSPPGFGALPISHRLCPSSCVFSPAHNVHAEPPQLRSPGAKHRKEVVLWPSVGFRVKTRTARWGAIRLLQNCCFESLYSPQLLCLMLFSCLC